MKIGRVIIIGVGNVNSYSSAEYNFYDDPEAASIVLSEMKSPLTLVPWEAFFIDGFKVGLSFYCVKRIKRFVFNV